MFRHAEKLRKHALMREVADRRSREISAEYVRFETGRKYLEASWYLRTENAAAERSAAPDLL